MAQNLDLNVVVKKTDAERALDSFIKEYSSKTIELNIVANTSAAKTAINTLGKIEKAGKSAQEAIDGKVNKNKKTSQEVAVENAKKTATQLETIYKRLAAQKSKLETDIKNTNGIYNSKQIKGFQDQLNTIKTQMKEISVLKGKLGKNPAGLHQNDYDASMKRASTYLTDSKLAASQVENTVQANKRAAKSYDEVQKAAEKSQNKIIGFDKIGNRLNEYYSKYGNQIQKNIGLYNQFMTLMNKAQNGGFASVQEANRAFAQFRMQCRGAGVEVESIGSKLERTFGARVRSALAGQGVYMIQTALRGIVQNAIDVDTAMTELKKVTDATDTEYAQFMDGASVRAQKLGATLKDVVSATADYARLGYDIPDATKLADSAILYLNVGDDVESMDQATKSLISTMQGFGIAADDSSKIVDKFNEVANNYASSAGDIGDITMRSAASMAAAGNTLDETIALGVTANEVQQDADTVGTALKFLAS